MTLEEARLLANVNERSRWLYETGYRARWTDDNTVTVKTPHGGAYTIDHADGDDEAVRCSCPFFVEREGRLGCKHLLGYRLLLMRVQQARTTMWAEYALPQPDAVATVAPVGKGHDAMRHRLKRVRKRTPITRPPLPCFHVERYKSSRFWAVYEGAGRLVCVCVYKKGAAHVIERLSASTASRGGVLCRAK